LDLVTRAEMAEQELNRFVERRHDQRVKEEGDAARIAAAWAESCDKYNAARQHELAWQWLRYHVAAQRTHRRTFAIIDAHHEAEIRRYEAMLNLNDGPPEAA
jgi:hypothetical protein